MYKAENRVEIPSRSRHEFCTALEKLGYETNAAHSMGTDLRCKFNALYRRTATSPTDKIPTWSRSADISILVPALFVGAWEDRKAGDRALVSAVAGMPYEEYISSIYPYTKGENAPLFCVDGSYACIATADLWDLLWSEITPDVFKRFGDVIINMFSDADPTYDLPKEQWFAASMYGKESAYSEQLKRSCIVSLIMLTDREDSSGSSFSAQLSETCKSWVRQIFEGIQSLNQWRTICPHLTEFMEAVPDVVLHRIENASTQLNDPFWKLFEATDNPLFERSFYTHILWALENAVWDRRYASRAVSLLVRFAVKGFRYTISNWTINSLYKIICLWHPQGCFTLEEQKILLQNIIENHHSIAAELVDKLLPNGRSSTSEISKPKWRAIECKSRTVYMSEFAEMTQFITTLYLDNITPTVRDWEPVLQNLDCFKPIESLVEKCKQLVPLMPENDVYSLCAKIARYISNSRSYHHDNEERMWLSDIMESLLFAILPDSPRSYTVFYSDNFNGLIPYRYKENEYDYDEERRYLREYHKKQMHELLAQYGKDAIIMNVPHVENLRAYGVAIAEVVMQSNCDWAFISKHFLVFTTVNNYFRIE